MCEGCLHVWADEHIPTASTLALVVDGCDHISGIIPPETGGGTWGVGQQCREHSPTRHAEGNSAQYKPSGILAAQGSHVLWKAAHKEMITWMRGAVDVNK